MSRNLALSLILVVSVISILASILTYWGLSRKSEELYRQKSLEYIAYLHNILEQPIWNMDVDSLTKICNSFLKNEMVAFLRVTNAHDNVLFEKILETHANLLTKKTDIEAEGQVIGHVTLGLSPRIYQEKNRDLFLASIFTALVVIISLAVSTRLILKSLLQQPLDALIQRIEDIGAGEYESPVTMYHQKEITTIISKFNIMAEQVKSRELSLLGINEQLAAEIEERKNTENVKSNLEKQLFQAQKMEAVGTLAGGIAHDFNNILAAIIGYTEIATEDLPPESPIIKDLDEVYKAGNRAKELVKQILAFSRQSKQELRPVQIHLIVKEALKLLRSSIPTTIEIRQDIDPQSGKVLSDATQIHQITMNLCTNAYHAMRETGGVLAITMRPIQIKEDDHKVKSFNLTPGLYVELAVSDSGVGMDRNTIDKIFNPYFTTKKKGEGTGLGLSVVHGIVKSYGGDITVYSEPGEGTTFRLCLPRIVTDINSEKTKTAGTYPTGNERALIVDDEEAIVNMIKRMLTKLGYHITAMTSSNDALQTFQKDPDGFDFMITDMTMPNMNGAELIQRVRVIRPNMPIILCTGFSELIDKEKASSLGIQKYLMKPVVKKELAVAVREVLGESAS